MEISGVSFQVSGYLIVSLIKPVSKGTLLSVTNHMTQKG